MWRESIVEFVIDILKFPPSISSSSSPSSPSLQADAFSSSFYNVDDVFATTTKGGRGGGEGGGEGRISSSLAAAAQGFSTGAVTLLLADLILATITSSAPSKVTLLYNYLGHQFDSTIFPFWIKIASYVSVEHYSVLSPFYEFMFAHLRSAGRNQQNVSSAQWNFYNSVGFTPTFRLATRLIACGDKRMTKVIFQTLHSISSIRNRELRERVRPLIPEAVENVFAYMHLCGLAVATQLWRVVNCWSENFSEEFFATCQNCAEASSRESVRLREEEKEGNTKTGESSSSLPSKCFWIALTDPHRQLVLRCFQQIHGPRILQLLHDLCNIANGDMSADCLVTYELALQSSTTPSSSNSSSSTFLTSGNTYDTRNRNCAAINQEVEEIL